MTGFYCHVRPDGSYGVHMTTNGHDRIPVPDAIFGNPRDAIRFAEMRELNVSPLRAPEGAATDLPQSPAAPSGFLTGPDPRGGG